MTDMNPRSSMFGLWTAATSIVLLVSPAVAAEHTQADAQKAVEQIVQRYTNLYDAKNAKGIADLFADDGVEVPLGRIVTGHDNIEKWFQSLFAQGVGTDLRYDIKQVQLINDHVFAIGLFTVKEPNGSERRGSVVNIYEWRGDALKYRVRTYNLVPAER